MRGQLRLTGGRKIQSPPGLETRPTTARVREAVMNLLGSRLYGCHWLDLFSGSGAMGCEALQKGAQRVVAIEHDRKTAQVCKSNLLSTASGSVQETYIAVITNDVPNFLRKGCTTIKYRISPQNADPRFDLVYLDPPYNSDIYSSVLDSLLKGCWLRNDSIVICEHSSDFSVKIKQPWIEKDRRLYGNSSLLLISPPENHPCDIDSKQLQIGPEA